MEDYISIEETRRVLGVSRFTLYRWRLQTGMPFEVTGTKFGRDTFGIKPSALREWALRHRVAIKWDKPLRGKSRVRGRAT